MPVPQVERLMSLRLVALKQVGFAMLVETWLSGPPLLRLSDSTLPKPKRS